MHVHGFNLEQQETFARHALIADGLKQQGFGGVVVSFDWPTNGVLFDYKSDRADAHTVAPQLLLDGVAVLRKAAPAIKIDIMAHSMGSLVTRHAFQRVVELGKADSADMTVGQVLLVAADIAAKSMKHGARKSAALYAHAGRVTNYYTRGRGAEPLAMVPPVPGAASRVRGDAGRRAAGPCGCLRPALLRGA
jgi:esterase/lipase superfamily enzyme